MSQDIEALTVAQIEVLIEASEAKARAEMQRAHSLERQTIAIREQTDALEEQNRSRQELTDSVRGLIADVRATNALVCELLQSRPITNALGEVAHRMDRLVSVVGQLVVLLPALIRQEDGDVMEELKAVQAQMFGILDSAVSRPNLGVQTGGVNIDEIKGDVSGSMAGGDIDKGSR